MRLYLSSFDVGGAPEELTAIAREGRRAAVIVNALDNMPEQRNWWLEAQSAKLVALGFVVAELDLRRYFGNSAELERLLKDVDLVWINGGNTFILRRAMRQSGFDELIKAALQHDDIVYAGFSAAAVIVAPSLRGLEFVDDPNDVPSGYEQETIWDGLGLLPFAISVRFNSDHGESADVEKEIAFYQEHSIPFRTLRDGEALVVDGVTQRVVGVAS
jgi:dipeptidase E